MEAEISASASPLVLSRNFAEIGQCLPTRFPWIHTSFSHARVTQLHGSCPGSDSGMSGPVLTLRPWMGLCPSLGRAVIILDLPYRLVVRFVLEDAGNMLNILFEKL